MIPVLLLLLSAALNTATSSEDSSGLKFVVAFPENIAYFHPGPAQNKIYITSLDDNTKFSVWSRVKNTTDEQLTKGRTQILSYDGNVELTKSKFSDLTLRITSTEKITVNAVSSKNTSMQTLLVIPDDQLVTKYFIPPVPTIHRTTDNVTIDVTERQPFKLIIVNTDKQNKVTVEAQSSQNVSLEPHQVGHVFITDDTYRAVTAEHPVAVIFGHTCAIRHSCTCSLLYAVLQPTKEKRVNFYIPTAVTKDAEDETVILLSDEGSFKKEKFNSGSPRVETAGTAILFRPGLLLNLIPETDFAACYLIHALPDVDNYAVIVVHKDDSKGVHLGESPLEDTQWETLKSTDYVSAKVPLEGSVPQLVWHSFSTMAVYYQGNKNETLFGNPATVISKSPDHSGCALHPEVIVIGEEEKSWQESVKYCKDKDLMLISFTSAAHQRQIYSKLNLIKGPGLLVVWIGMRRSSLIRDWYWLSKAGVIETNWAKGEPGTEEEGQCAIMSVESGQDFGWSDQDCCVKARPVCYNPPVLFTVNQ